MVDHILVDIDVNDDAADLWSAEEVKTWLKYHGYKDLVVCIYCN